MWKIAIAGDGTPGNDSQIPASSPCNLTRKLEFVGEAEDPTYPEFYGGIQL